MNTALFIVGYSMTGSAMLMLFARVWQAASQQRLNGQSYEQRTVRPYIVCLPNGRVVFVRASTYANAERVALRSVHRQEARRGARTALR